MGNTRQCSRRRGTLLESHSFTMGIFASLVLLLGLCHDGMKLSSGGDSWCSSRLKVAKRGGPVAFAHDSVPAELGTISGAGRAWDLNERPGLNGRSYCYHLVNLTTCSELLFPTSRFALSAMDMEQRDYDSRTALHVAAAEGNA